MDRIRKALDLARQERARLFTEEEHDRETAILEPRAVSPVVAPFVAPRAVKVSAAAPDVPAGAAPPVAAPAAAAPAAVPTTASAAAPALDNATTHVLINTPAIRPVVPKFVPAASQATVSPRVKVLETPLHSDDDASQSASMLRTFTGVVEYTKTRTYTPPSGWLESNRIIDSSRGEPAAAAFRMLRTQVLQRMEENGWRSLAILSPNAEDGKTTTATNLAVSLASDHRHTVLLVDCDLKRPGIARVAGIEPEFGLDDVLSGRARVDQCLYHPDGFERLVILPAKAALANSSEALSGPRARELVSELRSRYSERIILFDLPPILRTDDALAFLPLADCALVVIAERMTRRDDLVRCMELVTRTPIVGTVLTRSAAKIRAYG